MIAKGKVRLGVGAAGDIGQAFPGCAGRRTGMKMRAATGRPGGIVRVGMGRRSDRPEIGRV